MDLKLLIEKALEEDLGVGDITTDAVVDSALKSKAQIIAKQDLVLAGIDVAHKVFVAIDSHLDWSPQKKDGQFVTKGECIAKISGSTSAILKGERVALNFLQHLCGIATRTHQFVEAVKGTNVKILDTRKTLPGWRALEKYAVRMGGGNSHRLGLFDRYLIKNNHITAAGSIASAIEKVLENKKRGVLIQVEVKNLEELKTALAYPIDIVLLDNFSPSQIKEALKMGKGKAKFEASGGINLDNVAQYAATGVDFISSGALTHSAPAADIHLIIK
ncbi:MAG: carboxylating nicotinate-nucleotide diphosphorylase [Deltaproteobacteria bacterium]|nr:carboxylating nicotinate-nucleotide diphosphorylase [Deltaproteobacteria bacterium]